MLVFTVCVATALLVVDTVWRVPVASRILMDVGVATLLASQLLSARERRRLTRERTRMSAQLHDQALQYVFAARQDIEDAQSGESRSLQYARSSLDALTVELRQMMLGLQPPKLRADEVSESLRRVGADAARRGGFALVIDTPASAIGPHADLVFAIARELVANAAKHAEAAHVRVTARREGHNTLMEVVDDGCGFDENRPREAAADGHLGLTLISRRVASTGGSLVRTSAPGQGTHYTVRLPWGL